MLTTALGTILHGLSTGSVDAVIGLGFALLFQSAGAIDFARGPVVMATAAVAYGVHVGMGLPWPLAALAAVAAGAALGVTQYFVCIAPIPAPSRLAGSLVATLGFGVALTAVVATWFGSSTHAVPSLFSPQTFTVGNDAFDTDTVAVIPVAVAIATALWATLRFTSTGRHLRAIAEDREAAAMRGINPALGMVGSFVIAGVIAGIGGVVIPPASGHDILVARAALYTLNGFIAVVLGGTGSIWGAVAGGWLLGLVESAGTHLVDGSTEPLLGLAVLFAVLIIRPQGIFASPRLRAA